MKRFNPDVKEVPLERTMELEGVQNIEKLEDSSSGLLKLCGILKPFSKEEIEDDPRLEHILRFQKMTEETRELKTSITLTAEEWENLERYAANGGKTFQEYIDWYFQYGLMVAQREGKIFEAFQTE